MKKSKTTIIVILGVIALLTAGIAIAFMIPSGTSLSSADNGGIILYSKTGLVPEYIAVKNDSGEYELMGYIYSDQSETGNSDEEISHTMPDGSDVAYTMQDHPDYLLQKELTDSIVAECEKLYAKEVVDKSGTRYKEFGLEEPVGRFTAVYSDDSQVKIDFGSFAPDNKGIYVKADGDKNVYLVESSSVDAFFIEKLQLFDKTMTGVIDEVLGLTVSGEGFPEEIKVTENTYGCYPSRFIMADNARTACSDDIVSLIYTSAQELKGERVAAIDVTESDLKTYGLDKPYEKLTVKGKGGQSINLLASKADSDGYINLMTEGSKIIYTSPVGGNAWYGISRERMLNAYVFRVSMPEVTGLRTIVGNDDLTYKIVTTRSQSSSSISTDFITVEHDGRNIPFNNISAFIADMNAVKRTDDVPENTDGFSETVLEIQLGYETYPEITDTLKFVRNSEGKTAAILNGTLQCYVSSEDIDKLAQQAALVPTSPKLDPVLS